MKKTILGTASTLALALCAANPAFAQNTFDWSGVYVGGTTGSMQMNGAASLAYGSDTNGWSNGAFLTERDTSLADSFWGSTVDPEYSHSVDGYAAGDPATDWLESFATEATQGAVTAFAGWQTQVGAVVYGGEVRVTTGTFGYGYEDSWNESSDFAGSLGATYCCLANYLQIDAFFDDPVNGFDPEFATTFPSDPEYGYYDVTMTQDNALAFDVQVDNMVSAVGRVGFAVDRAMIFAMGGATFAQLTATTSASVTSSGVATSPSFGGYATDYNGNSADYFFLANEETFSWEGTTTQNAIGYTVGGGIEYALTNNVILRLEAEYFNLGNIEVLGESEDAATADYTVSHTIDGVRVGTGISFLF